MHAAAGGAARPPSSHTHNLLGLVSSWPGWRRAPWALVGGVGVGVESTTGHVLPPASPRPRLELACGAGEPVPPVEECHSWGMAEPQGGGAHAAISGLPVVVTRYLSHCRFRPLPRRPWAVQRRSHVHHQTVALLTRLPLRPLGSAGV